MSLAFVNNENTHSSIIIHGEILIKKFHWISLHDEKVTKEFHFVYLALFSVYLFCSNSQWKNIRVALHSIGSIKVPSTLKS